MIISILDFPISGPLKIFALSMEWLNIFLFFEFALIFLAKYRLRKNRIKNLQDRAYFWLFLGYSIMWIFIIIRDYYVTNPFRKILIENIGYFFLAIFCLLFIFFMETNKNFLRKYIFTFLFAITIVIYICILFFALEFAARFTSLFWIIFYLFILFYVKKLYTDFYAKKELVNFRFDIIKLLLGMFLIGIGFLLTSRWAVTAFGLEYRILGDILQLIGAILLALFFHSVPTFSEHDWQKKIDYLLVVHKSGLSIYKKSFQEQLTDIDANLIAGNITTIEMFLENTTTRKNLSVIEKNGRIIIIYPGKYIYGVLISREKLKTYQILLSDLIEKIEIVYYQFLKEWKGNLKMFETVENIVHEVFY
jgi:hypothetical protein